MLLATTKNPPRDTHHGEDYLYRVLANGDTEGIGDCIVQQHYADQDFEIVPIKRSLVLFKHEQPASELVAPRQRVGPQGLRNY